MPEWSGAGLAGLLATAGFLLGYAVHVLS